MSAPRDRMSHCILTAVAKAPHFSGLNSIFFLSIQKSHTGVPILMLLLWILLQAATVAPRFLQSYYSELSRILSPLSLLSSGEKRMARSHMRKF